MRLLDLYCGAGGAAVGYHRAGYEIVGVDIEPQPSYPFAFVQADALDFLAGGGFDSFDAIHASPPCQAFSVLRRSNGREYPDLIEPTRELLRQSGKPWVIENVPAAPLDYAVELCGSMFGLGAISGDGVRHERKWRQLRRHRRFELSWPMLQPPCSHAGEALGVYGGGPMQRPDSTRGGYQGTADEKRRAMQTEWMTAPETNLAIPPAYTELIGTALRSLPPATKVRDLPPQ